MVCSGHYLEIYIDTTWALFRNLSKAATGLDPVLAPWLQFLPLTMIPKHRRRIALRMKVRQTFAGLRKCMFCSGAILLRSVQSLKSSLVISHIDTEDASEPEMMNTDLEGSGKLK